MKHSLNLQWKQGPRQKTKLPWAPKKLSQEEQRSAYYHGADTEKQGGCRGTCMKY
jgi:hypothetical protein